MKNTLSVRLLALLLAFALCFGLVQPAVAFATEAGEEEQTEETTTQEPGVADFASFLENLKILEVYADAYAETSGRNANELTINFIRTGVDRYNDGNWKTLAGEEITGFTTFVQEQDAANGTTAMLLRNIIIDDFYLPNGNQVDFGHMFGTLNIAYVAAVASADLGGWAGDICDLMIYSKNFGNVPAGTVEEMAAYILENCFGVNADDAFGMDDFYGDMDAYYLNNQAKAGNKLSTVMESYFTAELSDADRAAYFLNNRFSGLETQEDVREAVYNAYANNVGLQVLEADRGLSEDADLRTACCYAFADYLFRQGGDRLEGGSGEEGGESGDDEEVMDNEYYTVFSSTSSILAPGIEQTIRYATTADKKQIVYYVATVDVTRDDVTIMANYRNNDPSQGWGMQRVEDQAAALLAKHTDPSDEENYIENFSVIVATNGDGYNMSTGKPGGLLVMEGVEWHPVDGDGFFAILKDGTAMIGTQADYATYKDQIQEAIGGFGAVLIKDGKVAINKSSSYYTTRASRTAVGITAEGKVVMMVLDGRQEPFSAGGSMEEIAQIMLDAGCVEAINLDGGGSTTYLAKSEGSDSLKLINRPSDGYARSVATSLVAVSTAKSSKEFDHANISTDYDYLTMGTSLQVTAAGVSNTGNAAPIPEDAVWQVSDDTIGSITADGLFTAIAVGDVDVQLVQNGQVLASKTLHVVIPDEVAFVKASMNVVAGVPTELPIVVRFEGNEAAFNEYEYILMVEHEDSGVCDGLYFTASENASVRVDTVYVLLFLPESELYSTMKVTIYKSDEAVFDFDTATHGNRQFAWDRQVSNAVTYDDWDYFVDDTNESMDITYVFALDMEAIEIPAQLAELTYMLPGADTGAGAWDFLLQLAERVSVLTEVRIEAQFDPDLDVDISEMTVANEYFYKKSATLDENNKLTLICGWYDQTAAIDPETANPICILSGIKATPKDDAWSADDKIEVINMGKVSYKIFLRASSLYSFAQSPTNQAKYGLYPYSGDQEEFYYNGEPLMYNGGPEAGAYFGSTYAEFEDSFVLHNYHRQGWARIGDYYYYFVDNKPITGNQYLPSIEDASVKLAYGFEDDGTCTGTITGLFEIDGNKYYAIQGEKVYGWRSVLDANGDSAFYYFHPYKGGAAVDGACNVEGYNYVFEDCKCISGELVEDEKGIRYRFAGNWQRNQWIVLDGNYYFIQVDYYLAKDGFKNIRSYDGTFSANHLFDENGVWLKDVSGLYDIGEDTYLVEEGIRQEEAGIVYIDGYYYYFCSTAKAIKNRTYWPTKTNGLIPMGPYNFDEYGRITNPPTTNPPTTNPENPDQGETEKPEPKNGIVESGGKLYYYINDAIQYGAGLLKLTGDDGVDFYIYVRSNGQLAVGKYWITNTNGLLTEGMYTFDDNGKLFIEEEPEEPEQPEQPEQPEPPEEPEQPKRNGVVSVNGVLYYYVDDQIAYCAGLLQLADGSYIYVRSNGQLALGKYWITNTNGLMNQGMYDFGDDGIMRDPPASGTTPPDEEEPEVKNGIVDVNGTLYYYQNGTIAYGAGVLKLTDDNGVDFYIYVRSNGQLATGVYWPTTTNGLLAVKAYDFGSDGRLYL